MTVFYRMLEEEDKASALLEGIRGSANSLVFDFAPGLFLQIPKSAFAYWIGSNAITCFSLHPSFAENGYKTWIGLQTNEDFRWVRTWWESSMFPHKAPKQVLFAKGGAFSPFYADVYLTVRWGEDGHWIKAWKLDQLRQGRITANNSKCWNESQYFRMAITWPRRTQAFSPRVLPAGCIFSDKGPVAVAAVAKDDSVQSLLALLAIMNSRPFSVLLETRLNAADATARSYEGGTIEETPFPKLDEDATLELSDYARRSWVLKRLLDTVNETSHAFLMPSSLITRFSTFSQVMIKRELKNIQSKIDDIAFGLYGFKEADCVPIPCYDLKESNVDNCKLCQPTKGCDEECINSIDDNIALLSWCVGVAFGRFDLRVATGERLLPPEPEPFDPLPIKSPGMVPDSELPFRSDSAILVDDPGHKDDIGALIRVILDKVEAHDDDLLSSENCRTWLAKEFFPLHLKMYSKSRRKAPIYWQLSTQTSSYSVWLYIHEFSKDTLYKAQNDYIALKLTQEKRKLESMRQEFGDSPDNSERRQFATQDAFVEELRLLLNEVKLVAPLWNPDLDDGIIINFALLWRLVPQHKTWQRELKTTWDELCAGKYEWAHLAMHLWPERVIPKCAADRSLAIAHGLDGIFWVEGDKGKWTPRKKPTESLTSLVLKKTSPAVKAALAAMLSATPV